MKKVFKTILWICWLGIIYYFSSQNGTQSSDLSNRLLVDIANILRVSDADSFVKGFSFLIRKMAHFTEYFILFILTYECFKEYGIKKMIIVSLLFCVLWAFFDEFHQLFVDGRCGQIRDVLIDSCGSFVSYFFWHHLIKR